MNKLEIPYLDIAPIKTVDALLTEMLAFEQQQISCEPWPAFVSDAKASFVIAHDLNSILLKYTIQEQYLSAKEIDNGNIHNDSCVEFFIAFGEEDSYYNLEFNCLGFTKIGFGADRSNRQLLPTEIISKISFTSRINSNLWKKKDGFDWEILLIIPKEIFVHHNIKSFDRLKARGNFYKCGDGLPQPHFLSWNAITAEEPNFHDTTSFRALEFTFNAR